VRKYPEDSIHKGKVARLTDFGAFITLEAGVDGLVHISKLGRGKKIKHAGDVLAKDAELDVRIEKIDRENKKISLDLAEAGEKKTSTTEKEDDYRNFIPQPPKTMGTLGDLMKKTKKRK
jgi:small subunit ribosomal protein S1